MRKIIYFDHSATTPVDPEVHAAMEPYFTEEFGNPSSPHSLGRRAREAVEDARAQVAAIIGARPDEVYFTSGGTESDNWAVKSGCCDCQQCGKGRFITTRIEHHAMLHACEFMKMMGFEVELVGVDRQGVIDMDELKAAMTPGTNLVSVMLANNEVGTIEPVAEVARLARSAGIPVHTDAVQAVGKVPVSVNELGVDMLSISAHKLYGPKGIGALYIRKGRKIQPFMHGGSQERHARGGTHNVPAIVGLGKACELAAARLPETRALLTKLARMLLEGIGRSVEAVELTGHPKLRLPGLVSIVVKGIEGESMLLMLDREGIEASSGSACTSESLEPSHVLMAMGYDAETAHGSLRLSLGRTNTEADVRRFLEVFPPIVKRLREMSSRWAAEGAPAAVAAGPGGCCGGLCECGEDGEE